ncbi:MAG: VWA domain-containing protein [Planctomyces sp.]|nr:VWA domain-containing protein [Planctomyces sp.]
MSTFLPFTRPLLLVLLALPVWLLIRTWRRNESRLVLPFDHGGLRGSRFLSALVRMAECLPALLLAVAICLIAGPQQLGSPQSRRKVTNIEFCVDVSGSMTASFGEGNRYDAAMAAINQFVEYREGDAFGLTFFGNSFLHWTPLTTDVSAIKCAAPFMSPTRAIPGFGGTEIAKAVLACRRVLVEREDGDRMIVLVSDGYSSDLMGNRSQEIARELKNERIVLHAIHIAEGDVPPDVINLARLTGGEVYGVNDPFALEAVFQSIDRMQQTQQVQLAPDAFDDFRPYCLAGLVLLSLSTLCSLGARYTPW